MYCIQTISPIIGIEMQKAKMILKMKHDLEQCAHINKKKRSKPLAKSSKTKHLMIYK
jgi:hypothetical protein